MQREISFVATGDSFITRKVLSNSPEFRELQDIINTSDVRFSNLEITAESKEGIPSAVSGGTWAKAPPGILRDLKLYGFNMIAWANNHTLDYSYMGLQATEEFLNKSGYIHAGAGQNLASASEPRYLETGNGRVGIISVTSSFHESAAAGEQRPDMVGRPGVNPLRFDTIYQLSPDKMQTLRKIASSIGINDEFDLEVADGFQKSKAELFYFGGHYFEESKSNGKTTRPQERDIKRIVQSIKNARQSADYVLVSVHAHEMKKSNMEEPAEFLETFSRECIDMGADAIIGHGPHLIRGIEIYKGKPIFYSLGNFIFQNETVSHLPADFYQKYNLDHDNIVSEALLTRSKNETQGFAVNPKIWESILPVWKMENGTLKSIEIHPISLNQEMPRYKRGVPEITANIEVLERLKNLSIVYGTEIEIKNSMAIINVK